MVECGFDEIHLNNAHWFNNFVHPKDATIQSDRCIEFNITFKTWWWCPACFNTVWSITEDFFMCYCSLKKNKIERKKNIVNYDVNKECVSGNCSVGRSFFFRQCGRHELVVYIVFTMTIEQLLYLLTQLNSLRFKINTLVRMVSRWNQFNSYYFFSIDRFIKFCCVIHCHNKIE